MQEAVIVGIDEAGRGPLAGPVVAGACHIPSLVREKRKGRWYPAGQTKIFLADSKQMTEEERERAYDWIIAHCPWGVAMSSAQDIDTIGILASNEKAMQTALAMLCETITPTYLLVDGRDKFWFDYPKSSIIGGGGKEPSIAAASIIGKVTRDRLMKERAKEFPQYGFDGHKGYASPEHIAAIKKHGPCELHRMTFLRNILQTDLTPTLS